MITGLGGEETEALTRQYVGALAVASVIAPVAVIALLSAALFSLPSASVPDKGTGAGRGITRIYAADGTQLAALRAFETFVPVEPEEVPQVLKDAVVAIEDERFYSHRGLDVRAMARALWANVRSGRIVQGASTITQQYVKQTSEAGSSRTVMSKVREAVSAVRVERGLSKEEILHRYLSTVYFGGGAYGVGAAADTYFRKPVADLTLSEAALLAAVIRAPTALNPRSNPVGAERRRQVVLDRMHEQDRISALDYRAALGERVTPAVGGFSPEGPATVVHPSREDQGKHPYFVDYVRRYLVARFGEDRVSEGGLRVDTSLDPQLQALAKAAVAEGLAGTGPPLEMSLVSIDPRTGLVRALVGGRDFDRSQVNLALGACDGVEPDDRGRNLCLNGGGTGRQPGSAFKPFALARALQEGMSLRTLYSGPARYTFPGCRGTGCTVSNAGNASYGRLDLRKATAYSVNTVFAQLVRDVGVKETAALARRMGVSSIDADGTLPNGEPYGPSLALGAAEVSPLDMAAAYGTLATGGIRVPPSPVVKVTTPEGQVLEDNTARRGRRVLPAAVAGKVTTALRDVVSYGTGTAADIGSPAVAGKTGTAENNSDAWFVGYTRALSTAVWMGYADSQRPLTDVKGHTTVYGGTVPARTWAAFMAPALEHTRSQESRG